MASPQCDRSYTLKKLECKKKLCCSEYLDIFVSTWNPYLAFKHQRELFYVKDMLQYYFLYFLPLRVIAKYIAAVIFFHTGFIDMVSFLYESTHAGLDYLSMKMLSHGVLTHNQLLAKKKSCSRKKIFSLANLFLIGQ